MKDINIFLTKFLCLGMIITLLFSCDSRRNTINRLDALSKELQENSDHYTAEEWNEAAIEMNEIEEQIEQYQSEFTEENLKEIGRLKGICFAYFTKNSVKSLKKNMKDFFDEAEGFVEGFTKEMTDVDIEDIEGF